MKETIWVILILDRTLALRFKRRIRYPSELCLKTAINVLPGRLVYDARLR